ncbi:MAG: hypothetical protein U0W24_00100 [Bacteroidales bacterium]
MGKTTFNITEWLESKFDAEKYRYQDIRQKFINISRDINRLIVEMNNDSHYLVPFINGLYGDKMAVKGHKALINMAFRHQSKNIEPEEIEKLFRFEDFNGRLVILVHGLMNDETTWTSEPNDEIQRLGSRLEKKAGAVILYVRYNTGLHISENGKKLNTLIENLTGYFGDKLKEISVIAHSMGGLVTRSACYYGADNRWVSLLKNIVLIGVPNEGSYLARIAHLIQYYLKKVDISEKKSFAGFFDIRSNGIKDLSFGIMVDEDWKKNSGNEKEIQSTKVLPIPGVRYTLIAATLTDSSARKSVMGYFGDGLVEAKSALSEVFRCEQIKDGQVLMKLFGKENHVTLLESDEVEHFIRETLGWKNK